MMEVSDGLREGLMPHSTGAVPSSGRPFAGPRTPGRPWDGELTSWSLLVPMRWRIGGLGTPFPARLLYRRFEAKSE